MSKNITHGANVAKTPDPIQFVQDYTRVGKRYGSTTVDGEVFEWVYFTGRDHLSFRDVDTVREDVPEVVSQFTRFVLENRLYDQTHVQSLRKTD